MTVILNLMIRNLSFPFWFNLYQAPKDRHGENDRLFIEVVCWIIRTGAPCRDWPPDYGIWQSIYGRYNRWVKKNVSKRYLKF